MLRLFTILLLSLLASAATAEKRVALLIGNSDYHAAPALKNPHADVDLVGDALSSVGFEVTRRLDLTRSEIGAELVAFLDRETDAELGMACSLKTGIFFLGQMLICYRHLMSKTTV
jgi:hypothetical protein